MEGASAYRWVLPKSRLPPFLWSTLSSVTWNRTELRVKGSVWIMEIGWITLILLAKVFVYIRKVILARHGHRIAWFVIWGEWDPFMDIVEASSSPAKKMMLLAVNLAPSLLFAAGLVIAILDWTDTI